MKAYCDNFTEASTERSIEANWGAFKSELHKSRDAHIPSRMSKSCPNVPWFNYKIKKLIRSKNRLHKKAKRSGSSEAWEKFRTARKLVKHEVKNAHQSYVNKVVDNLDEDPRGFWKYISSKRLDNQGIPTLKTNGTNHVADKDKAQALADQFKSVFTTEHLDQIPFKVSGLPVVEDIIVTPEGVLKLLKDLDINKACGPDDISPKILKEAAEEIAPVLAQIFQESLDTGDLPEDWLLANISALYKKGDKAAPSNYRPVSLTSIPCKLLEHIVHSHISRHLEKHNILTPRQHGFRKHHSCVTQLVLSANDWVKAVDAGKQVDIAIFDFSKAFDTVPHERLKAKLHMYGIRGKLLTWITNFLTKRKQRVVINGSNSAWDSVDSGVPQGTVLGPLLFLLYINDIADNLTSEIRLFADDCILYRQINSISDCSNLQDDINKLHEWGVTWQMEFNAKKCYVMNMGNKKQMILHNYTLNNHLLTTVDHHQYLGVYLSHKCKWDYQYDHMVKKANRILGMLRRNLQKCSRAAKATAYLALVRPHLEYASVVCDPYEAKYINKLEMVQRRAARFVYNNYSRETSVSTMISDLGWDTLQQRREASRLILMKQILSNESAIPKSIVKPAPTRSRRSASGNSFQLDQPFCRTDVHKNSFIPRTCKDWNNLPDSIASTNSMNSFKSQCISFIRQRDNLAAN